MIAAPYFDERLQSWIFSRYRDVAAALRDPALLPASPLSTGPPVALDPSAHADFRASAAIAIAPDRLLKLQRETEEAARLLVEAMPHGEPVDLMAQLATPWSLEFAGVATGVPPSQRMDLSKQARCLFESACEPFDAALAAAAQEATAELATYFRSHPPLDLQMFVALAHSLPAFLGTAWWTLLQHPQATLTPAAIDELLRLAGPAKAQFRQAVEAANINGIAIDRHQRVVLMLDSANRDPDQFADPDEFQVGRVAAPHLAFGAGPHACVGAALVKAAAFVVTKAVLPSLAMAQHHWADPVQTFAMRYLKSLTFTRNPPQPAEW